MGAHAVPIYVVAHSDHYLSHVVNGVLLAVAHAVPSTCVMYQYLSHVVNGVLLAVVVAPRVRLRLAWLCAGICAVAATPATTPPQAAVCRPRRHPIFEVSPSGYSRARTPQARSTRLPTSRSTKQMTRGQTTSRGSASSWT